MDDEPRNPFEQALRAFAEEIGRSVERFGGSDLDDLARTAGVDPDEARRWADEAGRWLRGQMEGAVSGQPAPRRPDPSPGPAATDERLRGAGPHPLDVPTTDQGAALAALESGRWQIEPGTSALTAQGDGPAPRDALGLVRELRARDWIDASGAVTLAGRHALRRWLESSERP